MISGSLGYKKPFKQKSHHDKNQILSENESKECKSIAESAFSCKSKIKPRVEREKASLKDQLQKFALVKRNELGKEASDNESSEVFSKTNNAKVKISLKKCNEYFSKVNENGFSTFPPPLSQVICPLFVVLMIAEVELMAFNFMGHLQASIITGVGVLVLAPTGYFWWVTTKIVPTDSIQLQHLDYIRNPAQSQFNPQKQKYFCNLCKTCISHRSFHCNRCNRCVEYFDHHCKWLNNCIGSKNYVQFLQLIVWSELFLVFFFVVNGLLINRIVDENDVLPALLWFGVAVMALTLVPFLALSILLCLHLYLVIAKRTTLELILQSRKKNKIHPYLSGDVLRQKKPMMQPLPEESPINSPTLVGVENNSLLKDMNQENNESLIKFMTNLTKSLRLSKKGSDGKSIDKNQKDEISEVEERKINFKPTILKKTTCIRNQAKSNTEKTNKVFIEESKQQDSKRSDPKKQSIKDQVVDSDESEMDETAKNFVSRLKFSTKNEIIEDSMDEVRTSPKSQKEARKVQTERVKSIQRRETGPRRLQPLKSNQTQRKIKFQAKVQTFGKQNLNKETQKKEFSIDEDYCKEPSKKSKSKKKRDESGEEVSKSKAKSTRLFKVLSAQNKDRNEND